MCIVLLVVLRMEFNFGISSSTRTIKSFSSQHLAEIKKCSLLNVNLENYDGNDWESERKKNKNRTASTRRCGGLEQFDLKCALLLFFVVDHHSVLSVRNVLNCLKLNETENLKTKKVSKTKELIIANSFNCWQTKRGKTGKPSQASFKFGIF